MANKNLFRSFMGKPIPAADTVNHERAPAYALSPEHALAQYAATGCLNATFYATAEEDLGKVLTLSAAVSPEFIAKTAIYCRERGFMKDMPALLCAVLSVRSPELCAAVFPRVIDDGKMLRTFVQIMRSGTAGRKSLGTMPRRLVRGWLAARDDEAVFRASVGQSPSLADVVRMVHPKPSSPSREALYGYLLGRKHREEALPAIVRSFEDYKAKKRSEVPDVPFQMLTSLSLGEAEWSAVARRASFQMTRMNLNTFARHGVFRDRALTRKIAERLRDPEAIARARVLPYQLMVAFTMVEEGVPREVTDALQDAMEIAIKNVPEVRGKVFVLPDVSGSMKSPATGYRKGSTTAVRCIDVAALVAAAVLRKNPSAEVVPFEQRVVDLRLNARDSVMTNAAKLAQVGGGGTNCSAPLELLNQRGAKGDLVIYVSDNESWVDARTPRKGTGTMHAWSVFKRRSPEARLVCIDIQPNATTQAQERDDVLNIGGFSDQVFEIVGKFASGKLGAGHWVRAIEEVRIQA